MSDTPGAVEQWLIDHGVVHWPSEMRDCARTHDAEDARRADEMVRLWGEQAKVVEDNERLREALETYGDCLRSCDRRRFNGPICTCGFREAIDAVLGAQEKPPILLDRKSEQTVAAPGRDASPSSVPKGSLGAQEVG